MGSIFQPNRAAPAHAAQPANDVENAEECRRRRGDVDYAVAAAAAAAFWTSRWHRHVVHRSLRASVLATHLPVSRKTLASRQ